MKWWSEALKFNKKTISRHKIILSTSARASPSIHSKKRFLISFIHAKKKNYLS